MSSDISRRLSALESKHAGAEAPPMITPDMDMEQASRAYQQTLEWGAANPRRIEPGHEMSPTEASEKYAAFIRSTTTPRN